MSRGWGDQVGVSENYQYYYVSIHESNSFPNKCFEDNIDVSLSSLINCVFKINIILKKGKYDYIDYLFVYFLWNR